MAEELAVSAEEPGEASIVESTPVAVTDFSDPEGQNALVSLADALRTGAVTATAALDSAANSSDPSLTGQTAASSEKGTDADPSKAGATPSGAILTGGYNTHKIYIGNLPETATLADLEDCFGQLGQCTCSIKRGFGFVEYLDPACAAEAVAKYHEGHFLGAQIKVELSHARPNNAAKTNDDNKTPARNPPGSDRPSDSRKPMHINGPPVQEKRRRHNKDQHNPQNRSQAPPPPEPFREPARDPVRDRYIPGVAGPVPPPLRGENPPYADRYRDEYRGSPAPYPDPRYMRDYDPRYGPPPLHDFRGGPSVVGYGVPPPRDRPYDPYYDVPHRGVPEYPPYGARPPPFAPGPVYGSPHELARLSYGAAIPPREPYSPFPDARSPIALPAFDHRGPPGDMGRSHYSAHDPYGMAAPPADRYDPRHGGGGPPPLRDDRRYNPYGRPASPRGGGSPPRGPPLERRRSASPRRDYGPPSGFSGYSHAPPFDPIRGGPPPGGFGGPSAIEHEGYVPRQ